MYTGAGAAPLQTAALAWQRLAGDLDAAAVAYRSVISGLADAWHGPSSAAMARAAATYIAWLEASAAQCSRIGAQANAAAQAYQAALAATVPPPVIAANRAQLAALVATNLLGQNTPAIMETEAQYVEMWAQDVAAMARYQAQSLAATAPITPFAPAPQTTNPGRRRSNPRPPPAALSPLNPSSNNCSTASDSTLTVCLSWASTAAPSSASTSSSRWAAATRSTSRSCSSISSATPRWPPKANSSLRQPRPAATVTAAAHRRRSASAARHRTCRPT
ncbi:PPE family protein [Mycobacterium botniense]|uniref:PPE family protein n=1 Tax=Mycobacterium botniense TaxID=84962 RepID=UPI003FCE87E1